MGMKGGTEADILKSCFAYLRLRDIPCFRVNGGALTVSGPEGRRRFVRFTSARGCSDLVAVLPPSGRFAGIEVKRPGGRLTADQESFLAAVRKAGGVSLVVHSVGELVEELERLGGLKCS
jgi:hypothetical protein